jgi:hypothetical protein
MSATDTTFSPADVTAETRIGDVLETVICSRCGGSGRMPFSAYGGICFKCGGAGSCDTKRGAAARAFYRSLVRTPVEGLRAGDRILSEGFVAGTMSVPSRWVTVESVQDNAQVAAETGSYEAALSACGSCGVLSDADAVERAAAEGATLFPITRDGKPAMACFRGTRVEAVSKSGERHASTGDRAVLAKVDSEVCRAIYRTVAEYQENLTKAGTPRKRTRWAA